jgi:formimidoylglutamate deiminase
VGTDSNINVSVTGELCMLEYSQRLLERQRNVLASGNISTGTNLYNRAAAGGAQALGRNCGAIEIGMWADLVALEDAHLQLCALKPEQMLDGWIFASNQKLVTDVWSAGRHCVAQGRHLRRDAIEAEYRRTVTRLASLL